MAPWWRDRDLNPRRGLTLAGFQDQCIQPLCHPSVLVEDVGLEPTQPFGRLLSRELRYRSANLPNVERIVGIEPTSLAWKARVLPIYDTR